jgi:hypothetical protein
MVLLPHHSCRVRNIERGPNGASIKESQCIDLGSYVDKLTAISLKFLMSTPAPVCSPFAASPPDCSPPTAMQRDVHRISEGPQTERSSSPTLMSDGSSEHTSVLPSFTFLHPLSLMHVFTLVDSPTVHQFAGGRVTRRPSTQRRTHFCKSLDFFIGSVHATTTDHN